ncbi:MAG: hypothetical protein GY719_28520 [bacterium]|nr:hypothetical protein [bacterium]
MQSLVMTVIGKDRPGLVETLASLVEEHGGNWEESRLARLAGEFSGMLHISLPAERAADLEKALSALEGMSVVVAEAPVEPSAEESGPMLELEVVGQDHPGIVHRISEVVAARGVNIEELDTEVASAPMAGHKMFQARARLRAPKDVGMSDLTADLEEIAADLMIELREEEA